MTSPATFKCVIMSPRALIYENEVFSVFLTGDRGEYEILAYHYPIVGILKKSSVVVDWKESIPIKAGIVKFLSNECIILIEESEELIKNEPAPAPAE